MILQDFSRPFTAIKNAVLSRYRERKAKAIQAKEAKSQA
jgi:hypothetical protein